MMINKGAMLVCKYLSSHPQERYLCSIFCPLKDTLEWPHDTFGHDKLPSNYSPFGVLMTKS